MKKKAGRLVLVLTVLATIAAAYYGWRYWQLTSDPATATALSVKTERQTFTGKTPNGIPYRYFAEYTFTDADGEVRSGRQTIDRSTYDALAQRSAGTPVLVHYSRARPYVSTLSLSAPRNAALGLVVIALIGWGIVVSRSLRA